MHVNNHVSSSCTHTFFFSAYFPQFRYISFPFPWLRCSFVSLKRFLDIAYTILCNAAYTRFSVCEGVQLTTFFVNETK